MSFEQVIFDLDDTLIPTDEVLVPLAMQRVVDELKKIDYHISYQECSEIRKQSIINRQRPLLFQLIAAQCAPKEQQTAISEVAKAAFYSEDLPENLRPFPGVIEILQELQTRSALTLVSAGDPSLQFKKLECSGLREFFQDVYISDYRQNSGKIHIFEQIAQKANGQIACIGDRLDAEIQAGIQCGFFTIWVRQGDYRFQSLSNLSSDHGVTTPKKPDVIVDKISDIKTYV